MFTVRICDCSCLHKVLSGFDLYVFSQICDFLARGCYGLRFDSGNIENVTLTKCITQMSDSGEQPQHIVTFATDGGVVSAEVLGGASSGAQSVPVLGCACGATPGVGTSVGMFGANASSVGDSENRPSVGSPSTSCGINPFAVL